MGDPGVGGSGPAPPSFTFGFPWKSSFGKELGLKQDLAQWPLWYLFSSALAVGRELLLFLP